MTDQVLPAVVAPDAPEAAVEVAPPETKPAREVLRLPSFRRFLLAQLFASVGSGSTRFVFVWLALELSRSDAAAGLAGMALGIPQLVMMVPLGAVADRIDRRRLLVLTQLAGAAVFAVAAVLVRTDVMTLPIECVLAVAMGALYAAIMPTVQSLPAFLVPKERLMTASALQGMGMNGAVLLGPAVGGVTIAVAGIEGAFAVLAVLQLGAACAMARVQLTHAPPAEVAERSVARAIVEGARYTWGKEPVRSLVGVAWVVGLAWSVMFVLVPETSREVLDMGPAATSLLFSAAGAGLLSTSITLATRQPARPGNVIAVALTVAFGGGVLAMGLSRTYALTLLAMTVAGVGAGASMALQRGLLQRHTPNELMGRVMSISSLGLLGSFPIAAALSTALNATVGPATGLAVVGAMAIAAAGALAAREQLRGAW